MYVAVCGNKVECCFDNVAGVDRALQPKSVGLVRASEVSWHSSSEPRELNRNVYGCRTTP